MMGERRVMQEALFYGFSLEQHVPADHLLRKIDRFVDLSELRTYLGPYYSETGRPSIDPELMMRMLIVGYCFGIRSERRLCDEVHLNLAYRWFCHLGLDGGVPDHSTFSKNRHGRFRESDLFRNLFETVVARCIKERIVGGEAFAVDAQHDRGRRQSPARRCQGRGPRSDYLNACPDNRAKMACRRPSGWSETSPSARSRANQTRSRRNPGHVDAGDAVRPWVVFTIVFGALPIVGGVSSSDQTTNWEDKMATGLYILESGSVMVAYGPRQISISCAQYKANGYKPTLDKLATKPPSVNKAPVRLETAPWDKARLPRGRPPGPAHALRLGVARPAPLPDARRRSSPPACAGLRAGSPPERDWAGSRECRAGRDWPSGG